MPTKAQIQAENDVLKARLAEITPDPDPEPPEVGTVGEWEAEDGDPIEEDVERFLAEAAEPGADMVVDGYRYAEDKTGKNRGKVHFVHRWAFGDFDLQQVKDTYGGGKWNFRLKHANGGASIKTRTVYLEGQHRDPETSGAPSSDPRSFSDKILDTQSMIVEKLQEIREGPPPALQAQDPINTAMAIVGAFQSVLAPYQETLLSKDKEGPNFGELVKIFQQGVELGKISTPPAEDPMSAVLASTLPGLLSVIGGGSTPATPSPVDVLTNNPAPETTEPPAGSPPRRPPWDLLLSQWLPAVFKWAREEKDPGLRAAFVVDELPPEAEAVLLAQLRRGPEFFREFMLLHPEAQPWEEWLAGFWVAVADEYPWGEGDFGPHPFRETETADPAQLDIEDTVADDPEHPAGVEVGHH